MLNPRPLALLASAPARPQAILDAAVEDPYATRVLLQLLSPDNQRYLTGAVLEMCHPPQRTVRGSSGKMVTELEGDEVGAWLLVGSPTVPLCTLGGWLVVGSPTPRHHQKARIWTRIPAGAAAVRCLQGAPLLARGACSSIEPPCT